MIDRAKRKTLKLLSVATGSAMAAGNVVAAGIRSLSAERTHGHSDDAPLAHIHISTRVSALRNDIEVVLTNTGEAPAKITRMTPAVTRVARGEFDFSALLADGPLVLPAGESVTVPLTYKTVNGASANTGSASPTLALKLRQTMSVVTDDAAFAQVDVSDLSAFA